VHQQVAGTAWCRLGLQLKLQGTQRHSTPANVKGLRHAYACVLGWQQRRRLAAVRRFAQRMPSIWQQFVSLRWLHDGINNHSL
jgi:hypothetical protein